MTGMFRSALLICFCVLLRTPAAAHEFWIEPLQHILGPGDRVEANLKVGQDYSGSTFPYLPGRLVRASHIGPQGEAEITGIPGDLPALQLDPLPTGLHVLAYHSTADTLTFDTWELFESYVTYEGNDWALAAHLEAGLPRTGFTEAYTRYAKALVQVGPAVTGDADKITGLPLELVALTSPYAAPPSQDGLAVQLFWQSEPLANQQINVFHLSEGGDATLRSVATDDGGRAVVPADAPGRYLLNAVHMELISSDPDLAWDSHWASLTFEIPAIK